MTMSCQAKGDQKKSEVLTNNEIIQTASNTPTKACEALSKDQIADITGWESSSIISEEMMDRERLSVCTFRSGEELLLVRLAQKSEAAEKNKVLENQYKTLVQNNTNDYDYKNLDAQTIAGSKTGPGGFYYYILKTRNGNTSEIQLELSLKSEDNEAFEKMANLVMLIKK